MPSIGAWISEYLHPHVGFVALRRGGRRLMLACVELAAPHRHLLGVGPGQSHCRARRVDLLAERCNSRRRCIELRARLIELPRRGDAGLEQALHPLKRQPCLLEVGPTGAFRRLRRLQRCLRLANLALGLARLEAHRRFALAHGRSGTLRRLSVIGALGAQLVTGNHGHELIPRDTVAFFHEQLADTPRDLGADDRVVRRHHSREDQSAGASTQVVEGSRRDNYGDEHSHTGAFGCHGRTSQFKHTN